MPFENAIAQMGRVSQVPQQPCPWLAGPRSRYWVGSFSFSLHGGSARPIGLRSLHHWHLHAPLLGSSLPSRGHSVFLTFPWATLDSSKTPWRSPSQSVSASVFQKQRTSTDSTGGNRGGETEAWGNAGFGLDYWTHVETLKEAPPSPPSIFQEGRPRAQRDQKESKCHPSSPGYYVLTQEMSSRTLRSWDQEPLPPPPPGHGWVLTKLESGRQLKDTCTCQHLASEAPRPFAEELSGKIFYCIQRTKTSGELRDGSYGG